MSLNIVINPEPDANAESLARTATIYPNGSFDFKEATAFLRDSGASDLLDSIGPEDAWLERPLRLQQGVFLVRLSPLNEALQLTVTPTDDAEQPPDEAIMHEAAEWANRRFFLDVDMVAVKQVLDVDEFGAAAVGRFWPSRPVNLPDAWEGLLKTVISVQIYPGLAQTLQRALLDFYGDKAIFNGQTYQLYPTPQKLADVLPEELMPLRFSRQKARYVPGIASAIVAEPEKYDWETLRHKPGREAVAILDELPGVGPWTASYCAMRALPHLDVMTDEEGLRKTLSRYYDRRATLSPEEAQKLMEKFAPYRTFACYYTYMLMYRA